MIHLGHYGQRLSKGLCGEPLAERVVEVIAAHDETCEDCLEALEKESPRKSYVGLLEVAS